MCLQVPFGHVPTVKDWLKLTSEIEKPEKELPARPVEGLNCTKVEQSGLRWWGLIRDICGTPDQFFKHCFIYNYCPLAFFAAGGRNITPAEIKVRIKASYCLKWLTKSSFRVNQRQNCKKFVITTYARLLTSSNRKLSSQSANTRKIVSRTYKSED